MVSGGVIGRILRIMAWAAVAGVAIIISGCLVAYSVSFNAPSADVVSTFKPKATTRVDVLMTLGDPDFRIDDDRYFVYDWLSSSGTGVLIGFGGVGAEQHQLHALAIEFAPDGRLTRLQAFEREKSSGFNILGLEGSTSERQAMTAESQLWEEIRAWMKASDPPAR